MRRSSRRRRPCLAPTLLAACALLVAGSAGRAQTPADTESFAARLSKAAVAQTTSSVTYDGSYRRIAYPGGDVPETVGVCTDVVIRAYRKLGIDLQVLVHEDMRRAFSAYPQLWRMRGPDPNIDHRRVPNLQTYLARCGASLPISTEARDYSQGDLVSWMLPGGLPHIGVVAQARTTNGVPLVVHNIGRGPRLEDALFAHAVTGHYRFDGSCRGRASRRANR